MDVLDAPNSICGYHVKTRMQIVLTCLIPSAIQLIVYIMIIVVDGGLVIQHFLTNNLLWAYLTLSFVIAPALLTFTIIMLSPAQWPQFFGWNEENRKFLYRQLLNLFLFPIAAIYRLSRILFWSIESLFHDKNTFERHHALNKAAETSPFELYHFLQSFFQAAPQIILQLWLVLRENMFRNYDTTTIQIFSIILSLIKMAMTLESFQRFESQKIVGRNYPWCSQIEAVKRRRQLQRCTSAPNTPTIREEIKSKLSNFEENFPHSNSDDNRKTLNINQHNFNNFDNDSKKSIKDPYFVNNFTDDDKIKNQTLKNVAHVKIEPSPAHASTIVTTNKEEEIVPTSAENLNFMKKWQNNATDEDLIEIANEREPMETVQLRNEDVPDSFDESPTSPPPPRPNSSFPYFDKLVRLSTYKNMLIFNTEEFIKDHVPRLPPGMFEHHQPEATKTKATDEADILLPTRKQMIQGIEQDDIIAKAVSFTGWAMFIIMRMLSLSVFSVFFMEACAYLCLAHYLVMLLCIIYEAGIRDVKWQRKLFYLVLSYIYIFGLLEFKIKFKNVRRWYVGYFVFVFLQNLIITIIWMAVCHIDSFWYHFLFNVIIQSGILSIVCMVFYFVYLKPKDKVLFLNE